MAGQDQDRGRGQGQGRSRAGTGAGQGRAGAGIGQGSTMHETGQGRVRGTAGAADGAKAGTPQWHGRRTGEGQGRAMLGRGRAGAVAWQGAFGAQLLLFLLSIALEKGTFGDHKKRSGITYVTCMVVTPLLPI